MSSQFEKIKQLQSKRSNALGSNSRTDFNNSNDQSDFQIVIEFELRRQRQKTRILEERLHNKQVFIQQMKQYQDQLTLAFEKCQEQLIAAKKTIDQLCIMKKNNEQENEQLKHLIIRLEEQITLRDKDLNKRHYSSVKQQNINSPFKKKEVRSKTLMNGQEDSPKGISDLWEEQIIKQSKKIGKFIRQFLMMANCFTSQVQNMNLKNKLKVAWKWIKQVVKEWNDLRNQKLVWDNFLRTTKDKLKFPRQLNFQQVLTKILMLIQSR